jgi:large subunit ribosomal protein L21
MHAVVEIGGLQYKVSQHDRVRVPSLEAEVGKTVTLTRVLLTTDEKATRVGRPHIDGARVEAKVLEHGLGDKVIVFKKKRRKGYKVKRGHRQPYTELQITNIA